MYEEGYTQIVNVDISKTVTDAMTEMYKSKCPQMQCKYFGG